MVSVCISMDWTTTMATNKTLRLERPSKAFARLGVSRSAGYKLLQGRLLPSLVPIGPRARALPEHETDLIIKARIAGWGDDHIRELVRRIEAERFGFRPGEDLGESAQRGQCDD